MNKILSISIFVGGIVIGGMCLALAFQPVKLKSTSDKIIQVEELLIVGNIPTTLPEVKISSKPTVKYRTTLSKKPQIQCVYRPLESGGRPNGEYVKSCATLK